MSYKSITSKVKITGKINFDTAFHIGSGKEGELATDMGVLKDDHGCPVLPGSTLKGKFRSTAEKLAEYLGFTACLLDTSLSGVSCMTDQNYFKAHYEDYKSINNTKQKLDFIEKHTCDICQLFGSPLHASRIFFRDGDLKKWPSRYTVRDGVVIDRDSETARHGLKYDFEVASRDTEFEICIDLENPSEKQLAIVGAVIAEWEIGFKLGGFTTRGMGNAKLESTTVTTVDYKDREQLYQYLKDRKMIPADDLLKNALEQILNVKGGESVKEIT